MFSNIEVENAVMEVPEPRDVIPPRQIENVSTVGIREQNSLIPPTRTNQNNNSNRTGSEIITVSIQYYMFILLNINFIDFVLYLLSMTIFLMVMMICYI